MERKKDIKEQSQSFKKMINSYKTTYIIISAKKIGLFDILDMKPKTLIEISNELNIVENRIEPILNNLVYNKIISKNELGYFLDEYKDILEKNSPNNQLGYIDFAETIMKKYQTLDESIKNKNFSSSNFKELTEVNAENFMKGMEANAISQAKFISENYNFEGHKILDIGAGAGTYLITVAKKYNITGKMIDLAEMVKFQNKRIKIENLENKLISKEYNYNKNFPDEKFDDVFLFAIIHQEPIENVNNLLKNIYNHLNPDGRLFLTSFFLNEDKITPEFAVNFSVEMLMNSNNGRVYTYNEIEKIIKENSFKSFERIDNIPSPATLYIVQK